MITNKKKTLLQIPRRVYDSFYSTDDTCQRDIQAGKRSVYYPDVNCTCINMQTFLCLEFISCSSDSFVKNPFFAHDSLKVFSFCRLHFKTCGGGYLYVSYINRSPTHLFCATQCIEPLGKGPLNNILWFGLKSVGYVKYPHTFRGL